MLAVGVLLVALIGACEMGKPAAEPLPVLPIGGDFSLVGHDGQTFHLTSQRGKVVLVFFGYSSCPDACPTTLSKLSSVARRLGSDRTRVKVLYVSVDPARDTPAVLKTDLEHFDLDALGLTGTKDEIDKVVGLFGASYEIEETPASAAKYTVAHSTWVYAIDPKGRTRTRFRYEATVDEVVEAIRALFGEDG